MRVGLGQIQTMQKDYPVEVEGILIECWEPKEIGKNSNYGPTWTQNFTLEDNSGKCRCKIWYKNDRVGITDGLPNYSMKGKLVRLKPVSTKSHGMTGVKVEYDDFWKENIIRITNTGIIEFPEMEQPPMTGNDLPDYEGPVPPHGPGTVRANSNELEIEPPQKPQMHLRERVAAKPENQIQSDLMGKCILAAVEELDKLCADDKVMRLISLGVSYEEIGLYARTLFIENSKKIR